ncbi:HMG (high mobility group) box family protein [Brugia pahangi]
MSSAADDGADEVKVFRRNDADDVETAQSSHQLTEDKKDVALETELETRTPSSSIIGSKPGAFVKPSPTFPTFSAATLSPTYGPLPLFYPFFLPNQAPYGLPFGRMPSGPMDARSMSPTYAAFVMQQAAQTMSPTFEMYRNFPFGPASPSSLFQGSGVGAATPKGNPLAAATMMRSMQNAAAAAATSPHPLNSINQMRLPQMGSPITSMASNLAQQPSNNSRGSANNSKITKSEIKPPKVKEQHIKKPLNAFMWFMKENRPKLMEELDYKERQSAELNKELGRRWHDLPKEEQQRYYELAKTDREQHMQKYPGWSARENYAINKKKKRKRDKSADNGEQKKCRARFGVVNQDQWCKHCKRKKRCLWYREASSPVGVVSSTTPGTPGTPSSLSGPAAGGALSGRDTDSENDMDATAAAAAAERSRSMLNQVPKEQQTTPLICQ